MKKDKDFIEKVAQRPVDHPAPELESPQALTHHVKTVYGTRLHNYLTTCLRDRGTAEDAAQEVYLRLLQLKNVRAIRNPFGLVLWLGKQVCGSIAAGNTRRAKVFASEAVENLGGGFSPAQLIEHADSLEQVTRFFARHLSTVHADFMLLQSAGLTNEEIAAQTGFSIHTVKKYVSELHTELRQLPPDHPFSDLRQEAAAKQHPAGGGSARSIIETNAEENALCKVSPSKDSSEPST